MKRKGFTLIELMIVVAIIAVIAAIAIPNLLQSRIASNESSAVAALRTYLGAQNTFHRNDFYRQTELVYANPSTTQGNGNGYPDLYQVGHGSGALVGEVIRLIDIQFANSHSLRGTTAKAGYHFDDLETLEGATDPNYDFAIDCGLCAAPKSYNRSGRNLFIVDVTGTVYQRDAAVELSSTTGVEVVPVTAYPSDTNIANWLPVGSE